MAGDYELKVTPHLKEWGSQDKDRSGGIGAREAESLSDESLVNLLNMAEKDPQANSRDVFFRTIPSKRVAHLVAQGFAGNLPLFSNKYVRNLTHGHSSRWALLVDEILALPRVAGGKTPGALADQMLLASGPVEEWGHLFDLLQYPHAEYVESRSTLAIEFGDTADGNGDGTLDKGEVSQLGEGDLLRIFSINSTRGTHGDEAVAYHYLLREIPDMVQLGVIGAVVVTCSMLNRPDILEAFLTSKGTIDPNGLYRVLVLMAQDPSEMVGDVATVVVENLTPRQREVLSEIDRKESGGNHQAFLMGQTTRDLIT